MPVCGFTSNIYVQIMLLTQQSYQVICDGKKIKTMSHFIIILNILMLQNLFKHEVAKVFFQLLQSNLLPQSKTSASLVLSFQNKNFLTNDFNCYWYISQYATIQLQKSAKYQE